MSDTINHLEHKTLSHLPRFLAAWCNAVGLQPGELAQRAEQVKGRWISQKKYTPAQMKRFGSSRPHFYRLLKGQLPIELADQDMLQYLSEIFEIDVVQLFDALSDRVWPSVHLAPSDYIEAPLQDAAASGARYFFPPEQLAGCPMHHLYLELEPGGTSGLHRHFAGTEMVRLDTGDTVTLCFPSRAKNSRQVVLHQSETVFFDATLLHQIVNDTATPARIFISRNYDFDNHLPASDSESD